MAINNRLLRVTGTLGITFLLFAGTAWGQTSNNTGNSSTSSRSSSTSRNSSSSASTNSFTGATFGGGLGSTNMGNTNSSFGGGNTGGNTGGFGGGNTGGFGGGNTGGGMSGVTRFTGPAQTNPFGTYYANPLQYGLPTGSSRARFGTALYTTGTTTTPNLNTGTATTNRGNGLGMGANSQSNVRQAPRYSATVDFPTAVTAPSVVQSNAMQFISTAPTLPSRQNMNVVMDGSTVVIRGTATNAHERDLAEAILRLSPGVYEVRNEIKVTTPTPPAPIIPNQN